MNLSMSVLALALAAAPGPEGAPAPEAQGHEVEISLDDATSGSTVADAKIDKAARKISRAIHGIVGKEVAAEEIARWMKEEAAEERRAAPATPGADWVEIVVPIGFFATIVGVVALTLVFRTKREMVRHETIRLALEQGTDIPTDLFFPTGTRRSDLRRGLILLFGGIGLMLLLAGVSDRGTWTIGLFPSLTGMGHLVYVWLERKGLG